MTFEAILFDCDGVLVDSEPITNGVLRELLAESGWALTPAECVRIFIGKAVRDERALIEANTRTPGSALPARQVPTASRWKCSWRRSG